MNLRRAADPLKALPLFGVLLLCGIDLETPKPPSYAVVARDEARAVCEQDAQCMPNELWNYDLLVSNAD